MEVRTCNVYVVDILMSVLKTSGRNLVSSSTCCFLNGHDFNMAPSTVTWSAQSDEKTLNNPAVSSNLGSTTCSTAIHW